MKNDWTPKQKDAIKARGKTVLVSAAAGSGKTATLTERIIRKLTDKNSPASISRMLVVTFTRMSAADLKKKISAALSEALAKDPTNPYLSKQLVLLESAHICTIDSFYLDVVRSNFQRLSLPSNFRLADEGEMALLRKSVMDKIIEKHYDINAQSDDSFLSFVENFTSAKQSDTLSDVFLTLEEKLCSKVEGADVVLKFADELKGDAELDFFESRQGKIIHNYLLSGAKSYYQAYEKCCDIISQSEEVANSYLEVFNYEKKYFSQLIDILEKKNFALAREHAGKFNSQKLKALKTEFQTKAIVSCKSIRTEATAFIKDINKNFFSFDEETVKQSMLQTASILHSLYEILSEFHAAAFEEKIKRKAFDFNDIRRFAYQLLTDENGEASDIALSYREQFDEIYIDEYQDVDAMQDRIFTLISKPNNRFMVGDIKQSIYSFRGADTDVFAGYKKKFPTYNEFDNAENALIFMSNNFRCDENVVDFTNKVFSFLFGHCGESIEYTPEDNLVFSKKDEGRVISSPLVNVTVITGDESAKEDDDVDDDEEKSEINAEAIWIANEIQRLIKYEYNANGKKIKAKDIAIVMRTEKPATDIVKALDALNIPYSDNSKRDLFETPDVLLVISLLASINNPHKDIPLAATLYSPIFAYTMDELITIRTSAEPKMSLFEALQNYSGDNNTIIEKNAYFIEKLTKFRSLATSLSIDKLLNIIYRDLSLKSLDGANSKNLTLLYELARKFESGSFKGLNNFISYINELIENDKVPTLTNEEAEANAVKLITAHKSKGLDFQICFVCNAQAKFSNKDLQANLLYHPRAGIGLKLAYEGGIARLNTLIREAITLEISNAQKEEEMRILYVAMTRSIERLYITAHTRSRLNKLEEKAYLTSAFASDFKIKKCYNWLAMILASIYPLKSRESFIFNALEKDAVKLNSNDDDNNDGDEIEKKEAFTDEQIELVKERINFKYPHSHLNKIPAKLSVSKLSPTVLDDMDDDAATLESFDEAKILEIEEFFESRSRTTGADKGTATHLFLQFCDFENAEKNGVKAELSRLVERKFIAPQVADLINLKQVESFFKSDFYTTLKNAKKTYREQRFNILLPATHFTQDEEFKSEIGQEEVLVQGVIDLFLEDENGYIILCDYKTDYLTPEELRDNALVIEKMKKRHGKQLEYYAIAIKKFLGKAPDKILIYSLPYGEAVEVKL